MISVDRAGRVIRWRKVRSDFSLTAPARILRSARETWVLPRALRGAGSGRLPGIGVEAMSLYNHFSDKKNILDGIVPNISRTSPTRPPKKPPAWRRASSTRSRRPTTHISRSSSSSTRSPGLRLRRGVRLRPRTHPQWPATASRSDPVTLRQRTRWAPTKAVASTGAHPLPRPPAPSIPRTTTDILRRDMSSGVTARVWCPTPAGVDETQPGRCSCRSRGTGHHGAERIAEPLGVLPG